MNFAKGFTKTSRQVLRLKKGRVYAFRPDSGEGDTVEWTLSPARFMDGRGCGFDVTQSELTKLEQMLVDKEEKLAKKLKDCRFDLRVTRRLLENVEK